MSGNENKTHVGNQTGGDEICECMPCRRAQREGILSISILIPFAISIWYCLWCLANKETSQASMQCLFLTTLQHEAETIS